MRTAIAGTLFILASGPLDLVILVLNRYYFALSRSCWVFENRDVPSPRTAFEICDPHGNFGLPIIVRHRRLCSQSSLLRSSIQSHGASTLEHCANRARGYRVLRQ